jgi:hypothetical protein
VLLDPKQLEIKIVKSEKNIYIHIGKPEINSYYIKIKKGLHIVWYVWNTIWSLMFIGYNICVSS